MWYGFCVAVAAVAADVVNRFDLLIFPNKYENLMWATGSSIEEDESKLNFNE